MIIGLENWFLIILAIVWIIGAILQDLKRREVDNLWNFSLIFFALAYRAAVSVYIWNYWFFLNGVFGFIIFLILGNIFYYSRLFAGGDAKLLIALGAILPFSYNWIDNIKIFIIFILLFLVLGSIYALIWSSFLVSFNYKRFRKEFILQLKNYKSILLISVIFAIAWIIFTLFIKEILFMFIGPIIVLFPVLYIYAKSVEESCMIKAVYPSKVTEGDWLYKDLIVGNKKIKAKWEGISKRELKILRDKYHKKVLIKIGIPFTPSFLLGFLFLLYILYHYLWFFPNI